MKMVASRLYATVAYNVHPGKTAKGKRYWLCGFAFVTNALSFCSARVGFFYKRLIRVAAKAP